MVPTLRRGNPVLDRPGGGFRSAGAPRWAFPTIKKSAKAMIFFRHGSKICKSMSSKMKRVPWSMRITAML